MQEKKGRGKLFKLLNSSITLFVEGVIAFDTEIDKPKKTGNTFLLIIKCLYLQSEKRVNNYNINLKRDDKSGYR